MDINEYLICEHNNFPQGFDENQYTLDKSSDLCSVGNRLYPLDSSLKEIINGIRTSGYVESNTEINKNSLNHTLINL